MTKQNLSFSPFLYHILALNMKTVCISGETAEYFHYFSLISLKVCFRQILPDWKYFYSSEISDADMSGYFLAT